MFAEPLAAVVSVPVLFHTIVSLTDVAPAAAVVAYAFCVPFVAPVIFNPGMIPALV